MASTAKAQSFSGIYTFGSAGNVTSFDYNGSVITDLTPSALTKVGITSSSSSGNFRGTGWPTGATTGSDTFTGAVDLGKYIQFTITAGSGKLIDDPSITFGIGRSGTGPRQWQWRCSVDNYASPLPVTTVASGLTHNAGVFTCPDSTTGWTGNVIQTSFQDLTSITFRLYAYNSEASGGSGGLEGVLTFGGTLAGSAGALTVSVSPSSFSESGTNPAATGTVTRTGDTLSAVTVNLASNDISEATVPPSVEIPANETQATFPVTAINDNLPDGDILVTISATAEGLTGGSYQVTVQDDGDLTPILISQYYEGANSDKYIELHNPTAGAVDLTGFVLTNWTNSSTQDWKSPGNTPTGQLSLNGIVIPAGGYYLIKGSGAATPSYAVDYSNQTDNVVVSGFNGNDSIVLYQSNIFSPNNILDAVSFTDSGNQGADKSFHRLSNAIGYNLTPGSNITNFPAVWGSKTLAEVAAAQAADPWVLRGSLEPVNLGLSISPTTVAENSGNGAATGTITIPSPLGTNLTVNLSSSDIGEAAPSVASATILAGETSTTFQVNAVDDEILDGSQSVVFTATAAGYLNGLSTLTVSDDGEAIPAPTLLPGAIAFVGYNADGNDDLAFAALVPIAEGDKIYFNDDEWNGEPVGGTGAFSTGEGILVWTAPAGGVAVGTVVTLNDLSTTTPITNHGTVTRSGNFFVNASDETIYAYQGNLVGASGFLAGVATHSADSFVGTGLTASHVVYLPDDVDVATYVGSRSNQTTMTGYLALIGDSINNWLAEDGSGDQSNNSIAPDLPFDTTSFTISTGSSYSSWASANGTTQTLDLDHDNDGVSNGVEYFLGGNTDTTGFTPTPGVVNTAGTLSITWTKAAGYTGVYGTDFVVETSSTLSGAWTTETLGVNVVITGNEVKYTFPAGTKNFARLKVTGP